MGVLATDLDNLIMKYESSTVMDITVNVDPMRIGIPISNPILIPIAFAIAFAIAIHMSLYHTLSWNIDWSRKACTTLFPFFD